MRFVTIRSCQPGELLASLLVAQESGFGVEIQYESRTRPARIRPSPRWVVVGIILPLAAGPGLVLAYKIQGLVWGLAVTVFIASVALPVLLFLRGIQLVVRRRSPLGYGLGIGLLVGIGINLVLVIAIVLSTRGNFAGVAAGVRRSSSSVPLPIALFPARDPADGAPPFPRLGMAWASGCSSESGSPWS